MSIARRTTTEHPIGSPSYSPRTLTPPSIRRARIMAALTDLDRRTTQINSRVDAIGRGSFEAQELLDERAMLRNHRGKLNEQLAEIDQPRSLSAADLERLERYERQVATEVANRKEVREHFISRLEAAGEHSQAKIHRIALLGLDDEVRREFGSP